VKENPRSVAASSIDSSVALLMWLKPADTLRLKIDTALALVTRGGSRSRPSITTRTLVGGAPFNAGAGKS
jgi:hypothetical protein